MQEQSAFSTRFLPTDRIPEYNALLDGHLGKRREFLLGNKHSLELLQQTGVIAKVEPKQDNSRDYVVYMTEKPIHRRKRLPPKPSTLPNRADSIALVRSTYHNVHSAGARASALGKSESTPVITSKLDLKRHEGAQQRDQDRFDITKELNHRPEALHPSSAGPSAGRTASIQPFNRPKLLATMRSQSTATLLQTLPSRGNLGFLTESNQSEGLASRRSRSQSVFYEGAIILPTSSPLIKEQPTATPTVHKKPPPKGPVEHLLECDASYLAQIHSMKDQLVELEHEKAQLDGNIAKLRKKLRGVNAVHENDLAVAHCCSIMQHRLSKAEEEYMKLVTAQQQVKVDVDKVRRELLSMRKVKKKLEADIDEVTQINASIDEKIHASKMIRNQVSDELVELERKVELEVEEQKLRLPPEEGVVVDLDCLMNIVKDRFLKRQAQAIASSTTNTFGVIETPNKVQSHEHLHSDRQPASSNGKPRIDHQTAFRLIQQSLGYKDVHDFVQEFINTENHLLSMYKATSTLQEERVNLQKEHNRILKDTATRHASIRGSHQAAATLQHELQQKKNTTIGKIASYNELREVRNHEHTRLRSIMQRCLETLQAESMLSRQESIAGPLLISELASPTMLETLQKKVTEVAMTLKIKHQTKATSEDPRHCYYSNRGIDGRRSNFFSTKEVSKIVLGPREPSGSALAAIMSSVQPPSVDAALALTENNAIQSSHVYFFSTAEANSKNERSTSVVSPKFTSERRKTQFLSSATTEKIIKRVSIRLDNDENEEDVRIIYDANDIDH